MRKGGTIMVKVNVLERAEATVYYYKLMAKMLFKGNLDIKNFVRLAKYPKAMEYRRLRESAYAIEKLMANMQNLKGLRPQDINIFLDMDNTILKFSVGRNDALSLELQKFQGFFENLDPYKEAPFVVLMLMQMGFNVYILSACQDNGHCKPEKRESLRKHFPFIKDEQIIFVMNGENKAEKIMERGLDISKSILIDDYYVNIENWIDLGGVAIKKSYSGKTDRGIPQITSFNQIFSHLANLDIQLYNLD
jgi:5'(3')-deoxyribonucleotidase